LFSDGYTGSDQIRVGNGKGLSIHNIGSATLSSPRRSFLLKQLMHVPSIYKNLLSVRQFAHDNNVYFEFHSSFFVIKDCQTRSILHRGPLKNGLYQLLPSPTSSPSPYSLVGERTSANQWRKRLGHPALRTVKHVISKFSLPAFSNKLNASYVSYQQAKAHQLPFSASTSVFNLPLELIFSDVWGPSPVVSSNGNKYYVSFVDAFSRFTWLFPIQCKSDVFFVFLQSQSMVERLFNTKIKQIQTDWGGEFRPLNTFFHKHGILNHISCPHTHRQQGCVERKHRYIIDTSLALLAESHVPKTFWDEACQTSCYLINQLPTPALENLSPSQKLFNHNPNYNLLRIFGCACFPNLRPYNQHKFDFRSKECVFLGYSRNHKGYKCFHIPTARMYISRDVVFHEHSFLFFSFITIYS
jgi:hypothetical protein